MNAKEELLKLIESSGSKVKCADLYFCTHSSHLLNHSTIIQLKVGYRGNDWGYFLEGLDNIPYLDKLDGTIWLEDGSWLEPVCVGHMDGFDYEWEHKNIPIIPDNLL